MHPKAMELFERQMAITAEHYGYEPGTRGKVMLLFYMVRTLTKEEVVAPDGVRPIGSPLTQVLKIAHCTGDDIVGLEGLIYVRESYPCSVLPLFCTKEFADKYGVE